MMQHEGHVRILKSLKLFGMAHAIEELGNQNSPAFNQALPMLDSLIKAEVAEREVRSVNYQLRVAKFPVYRDLVGFGTLPRPLNHRMLDSPALRKEWPCESPGSRKVRSSAS